MFGDLMGQMQEQQEKLKVQIVAIRLTEKSVDGVIEITMSGTYRIEQIEINSTESVDPEMIAEVERITQESLSTMLPGGLGGLGNLLG